MVTPDNPILVALDTGTAEEAVRTARAVAPHVGGFKIGLRLLFGPGPATIAAVAALGKPVFADAKLHDIPSQVEAAARRLGEYGARWVTAHTAGGREMLESAVAGLAAGRGEGRGGVLGVTVLTSLDAPELAAAGITQSPGKLTGRRAKLALASGCEGVICSPLEINVVREAAPALLRVVPGIRTVAGGDDQQRTATAEEAIARGADYLVIGRPIVAAPDPVAAAAAFEVSVGAAAPG